MDLLQLDVRCCQGGVGIKIAMNVIRCYHSDFGIKDTATNCAPPCLAEVGHGKYHMLPCCGLVVGKREAILWWCRCLRLWL